MKKNVVKELSVTTYKGHTIRKVLDEFGYKHTFIDMFASTFEDAPLYKSVEEWSYSSVADAKRVIDGEKPYYIPMDLVGNAKKAYYNRFN